MAEVILCAICGDPASYFFKRANYVKVYGLNIPADDYINICAECNEMVSGKIHTYELLQVREGGSKWTLLVS